MVSTAGNTWNRTTQGKEATIDIYGVVGDLDYDGESPTAKSFAKELRAIGRVDRLHINVHSEGGSVWDGLAIYRALREFDAEKIVHVPALAASIASVVILAGDTIKVAPEAQVMIHNPMGGGFGAETDFVKLAERLRAAKGQILDIYERRTGGNRERLSQMMDAETWFTGKEIKAAGFADEVKADQPRTRIAAGPLQLAHLWKHAPAALLRKPAPVSDEIRSRLKRLGIAVNNSMEP